MISKMKKEEIREKAKEFLRPKKFEQIIKDNKQYILKEDMFEALINFAEHLQPKEERGIIGSNVDGIIYESKESLEVDEIGQLFENNFDCYADTWHENNDTIPPIMVEGNVVMAMTKEMFVKLFKEYATQQSKGVSDEEIIKGAIQQDSMLEQLAWSEGAKWMREQLTKKD